MDIAEQGKLSSTEIVTCMIRILLKFFRTCSNTSRRTISTLISADSKSKKHAKEQAESPYGELWRPLQFTRLKPVCVELQLEAQCHILRLLIYNILEKFSVRQFYFTKTFKSTQLFNKNKQYCLSTPELKFWLTLWQNMETKTRETTNMSQT
jgi:hypothetical protein